MSRASLTDPATWVPLARAMRRLASIPENTRTARALAPLLNRAERELLVLGVDLGQPTGEQRDAERLAETYRAATPEQRRTLLDRGRAFVQRVHQAVQEQIRRLVRGGSGGAVLETLRESEGELRDFLGNVGAGAASAGVVLAIVAIGLFAFFRKRS